MPPANYTRISNNPAAPKATPVSFTSAEMFFANQKLPVYTPLIFGVSYYV